MDGPAVPAPCAGGSGTVEEPGQRASTVAVAPILIFGWLSQRQLVQGLTFGAVK